MERMNAQNTCWKPMLHYGTAGALRGRRPANGGHSLSSDSRTGRRQVVEPSLKCRLLVEQSTPPFAVGIIDVPIEVVPIHEGFRPAGENSAFRIGECVIEVKTQRLSSHVAIKTYVIELLNTLPLQAS